MNAARWVVLCAVSSGCTAAKAQFRILSAVEELHMAEEINASTDAAFEHQMAVLYLDKAREKAGYGEYRVADALARKSVEWAGRAIVFMEKQRRIDVKVDDFAEESGPPQRPSEPLGPPVPEPEPEPLFGEEEEIEIEGAKPPPPPVPAPKPAPKKGTGPKP